MTRDPVIISSSRPATAAPADASGITRRGWLAAAWLGFAAAAGAGAVAAARFMFPNVLFEPPTKFDAGFPSSYLPGVVDTRWKQSFGVWIVRRQDGAFYALIAICKHLGCVPNWLEDQKKFKCPCHGSGYYINGMNFEGPAPSPLDRAKIWLSPDGHLMVDKGLVYHMVGGIDPTQQYPDSVLTV
jgi:cytochrome b6-f complex iron-sulfur subunit